MKQKLKLNLAQGAGEVLTREELKKVLGGTGSGSGSGSDDGIATDKFKACEGKSDGAACKWTDGTKTHTGKCRYLPFSKFQCTTLIP